MLQKSYNISISGQTIDATENNLIRWSVSGDITTHFEISIQRNSDNFVVFQTAKISSYATQFELPANSLINNLEYKIKITTWNEADQSISSDYYIFTTSSRPTITVDTIDTIGSPNYIFTATYAQSESVPMRYWSVYLYNSEQNIIASKELDTSSTIAYSVDNLQSEKTYYIEFRTTSNKNLSATSGLIEFDVLYTQPRTSLSLSAENVENAGIKLSWSIKQIIGESSETPVFIDSSKVDLTSGNRVWFDEKFNVSNFFTLKIWLENPIVTTDTNINEDDYLIMLNGSNGKLFLQYRNDNKFHLLKKIGNIYSHYVSEETIGSLFFVCIQQNSQGINLVTSASGIDFQTLESQYSSWDDLESHNTDWNDLETI